MTEVTPKPARSAHAEWTFLTNHSHVLIFLDSNPEATQREIAAAVGITERAVQRIIGELEAAGVVTREREGRRNHYELDPTHPLRHPLEAHRAVGDLLGMVRAESRSAR